MSLVHRTLVLFAAALMAVVIGCGSEAPAAEVTPTNTAIPEPTPTAMPTATTELPQDQPETPREIPVALTDPNTTSLGAVITGWQSFVDDGALQLPNEVWHLCSDFKGSASGELLNGEVLWSIAPPTPDIQPNEVLLVVTDDRGRTNQTFVLSYRDGQPTAIPEMEHNPGSGTPKLLADGPMQFQVFDSPSCGV